MKSGVVVSNDRGPSGDGRVADLHLIGEWSVTVDGARMRDNLTESDGEHEGDEKGSHGGISIDIIINDGENSHL